MRCNLCNFLLLDDDKFFICPNCCLKIKKNIPFEHEEKERYLAHKYDNNYKDYMYKLTNFIDFKDYEILDFGCGQYPVLDKLYPTAHFTYYDYYFYPSKEYATRRYDIILLIEVIEHISDVKGTLDKLISLLKRDGLIYIHTKLYDEKTDFKTWWYQRDITHISFFHLNTFRYIAMKYNLKLEQINDFIVLKKI